MSDHDLSDRYARIRTALAMAPTPGPWVVDRLSGSGRLQVNAPSSHTVAIVCHNVYIPEEVHAANARLIAACDPDTIRSLLAERDELAARQPEPPSARLIRNGTYIEAIIDGTRYLARVKESLYLRAAVTKSEEPEPEHVCDGGWACHFHDVKKVADETSAAVELRASPPPTDALTLEQLTAAIAYMGCDTDREYTPEAFARDLFAAARQSSTKSAVCEHDLQKPSHTVWVSDSGKVARCSACGQQWSPVENYVGAQQEELRNLT